MPVLVEQQQLVVLAGGRTIALVSAGSGASLLSRASAMPAMEAAVRAVP